MAWPLSQDYNEAIQSPESSFSDPELKKGEAKCNAICLPMPRSGNFADVYEFTSANGRKWAIKCFTREVHGPCERYAAISALATAATASLWPVKRRSSVAVLTSHRHLDHERA